MGKSAINLMRNSKRTSRAFYLPASTLALTAYFLIQSNTPAACADPSALSQAIELYNGKKYSQARDAFERVVAASEPSARLYYYTALANRDSGKPLRARQLFNYLLKNFPNTQEAAFARIALDGLAKTDPSAGKTTPETKSGSDTKFNTSSKAAAAGQADEKNKSEHKIDGDSKLTASSKSGPKEIDAKGYKLSWKVGEPTKIKATSEYPFSAADIARDGANGIDQMLYPNCWFEASMAALAELPRGQRLIASMIKYRGAGYVVRFPGDGVEYLVSKDDLVKRGIQNRALWASLIECAQLRKFPNNSGASGEYGDQSRLEVGLAAITGCHAEIIYPGQASMQELSSFIGGAVRSKNPIIGGTNRSAGPLVPTHAYTFIGFEPARNMVTLRNPHGANSKRFIMPSDPQHLQFEQLDDGIVKISLELVQHYFHSIARSFI